MSITTLTWHDFLKEAEDFLHISEGLGDTWSLHKQKDGEGNSFLVFKQKVNCKKSDRATCEELATATTVGVADLDDTTVTTDYACRSVDLVQIEYHVVYSISYQVPVLYFLAHRSDGSLLALEDCWRIFHTYNDSSEERSHTRADMLSIVTQMEHPVLFRPFLALHPCRTAELLAQAGPSNNRILTFVSLMGPYVHLNLSNDYGLSFNSGNSEKDMLDHLKETKEM